MYVRKLTLLLEDRVSVLIRAVVSGAHTHVFPLVCVVVDQDQRLPFEFWVFVIWDDRIPSLEEF